MCTNATKEQHAFVNVTMLFGTKGVNTESVFRMSTLIANVCVL